MKKKMKNRLAVLLSVTMLAGAMPQIENKMIYAKDNYSESSHYDKNGFCVYSEVDGDGNVVNTNCTEDGCSGYEPAVMTTDKYDIDSDGKKETVYEIENAGQLFWFSGLVNGEKSVCQGDIVCDDTANAVLLSDIRVNDNVLNDADGNSKVNENGIYTADAPKYTWKPIGDMLCKYTGTFDGQGHVVSGLFYNDSNKQFAGLFGCVHEDGKVLNVGVEDSYIRGSLFVGGISGYGYKSVITHCYSSATVFGDSGYQGGICGSGYATNIEECYNSGLIAGNKYSGGICGEISQGNIINCYNEGNIIANEMAAGGICGIGDGAEIANTYNIGIVSGTGTAGAILGEQDKSKTVKIYNSFFIEKCNSTGTVFETDYGVEKTAKEFKSGEIAYKLDSIQRTDNDGNMLHVWGQKVSDNNRQNYPVLGGEKVYVTTGCVQYTNNPDEQSGKAHDYHDGICNVCGVYKPAKKTTNKYDIDYDGKNDTVYEISNATDLYWFAGLVNGDNKITGDEKQDIYANAILVSDICVNANVLTDTQGGLKVAENGEYMADTPKYMWTPIGNQSGSYMGVFDGNNKTISGIYADDEKLSEIALFGNVGQSGMIFNLNLEDSYFCGKGYIGGICASNEGVIGYCSNHSTVVSNADSEVFLAGINAKNHGTIFNCYNTGNIIANVNGCFAVGGICGYIAPADENQALIKNTYNVGDVKIIRGDGDMVYNGSICGYAEVGSKISNSYYLSETESCGVGDYTEGAIDNVEFKSANEFENGCVAYLLQSAQEQNDSGKTEHVWGQDIEGEDCQLIPVLNGKKVYVYYIECMYDGKSREVYTNDVTKNNFCYEHEIVNGSCVRCNIKPSATVSTENRENCYDAVTIAVDYAKRYKGSVVTLQNDSKCEEEISVDSGDFVLDLNGKTLDSTFAFSNDSKVCIKDSQTSGKINVSKGYAINIDNTSAITLQSGEISCKDTAEGCVNVNSGTIVLDGGIISSGEKWGINLASDDSFIKVDTISGHEKEISILMHSGNERKFAIAGKGIDLTADMFGKVQDMRTKKTADQLLNDNELFAYVSIKGLLKAEDSIYTGSEIVPKINPAYSEIELVADTDYKIVKCENNIESGTANVKVKGNGLFHGTDTLSFDINAKEVTKVEFEGLEKMYTYTGKPVIPEFTLKDGDMVIPANEYTVTCSDNINVGTATLKIEDNEGGNYNVNAQTTYEIGQATPYIYRVPVATDIYYGDRLVLSSLSGGVACKSESDNSKVSGTFEWKDDKQMPVVADSNKKKFTVVFLPEDTKNYKTVEMEVTLNVVKKEFPPEMPNKTISVSFDYEIVGEVMLDEGWKWDDADISKKLKAGGTTKAKAIYCGEDKGNYVYEELTIDIQRAACKHLWNAGVVIKNPTSAKKGKITYTCDICGKKRTEMIPALGALEAGTIEKDDKGEATYMVVKSHDTKGTVAYIKPVNAKKSKISIPGKVKIDGLSYKVVSISANAFKNNKYVKEITIGSNVKTIEKNAFYKCLKLKEITIKTELLKSENIGKNSFKGISTDVTVNVPKKKYKSYKTMLISAGVNKKAHLKKI